MFFNNIKVDVPIHPIVISDDEDDDIVVVEPLQYHHNNVNEEPPQFLEVNNIENNIDNNIENNIDNNIEIFEDMDIDPLINYVNEGEPEILNNMEFNEEDDDEEEDDEGYDSEVEEEEEENIQEDLEQQAPAPQQQIIGDINAEVEASLNHLLLVKIHYWREHIKLIRLNRDQDLRRLRNRLQQVRGARRLRRLQQGRPRRRPRDPLVDAPRRGHDVCWGCAKKFFCQRIRRWGRCDDCGLWLCPDCLAKPIHCQNFQL